MRDHESLFTDLRDRFRDPAGWLLDALPWPLRKLYIAWRFHEKPSNVPDSVRIIGFRQPDRHTIAGLRAMTYEGYDDA